jgi:hypothetical protein
VSEISAMRVGSGMSEVSAMCEGPGMSEASVVKVETMSARTTDMTAAEPVKPAHMGSTDPVEPAHMSTTDPVEPAHMSSTHPVPAPWTPVPAPWTSRHGEFGLGTHERAKHNCRHESFDNFVSHNAHSHAEDIHTNADQECLFQIKISAIKTARWSRWMQAIVV